uniref:acetyl-CoA acetyltransferase, cytosolic 1-like n=1 Tax=Erigeron canadensis TaxID=72917 RepID=UPI001CB8E350|nr:acetyl-CoA acetyltransferase, cytosolic 1-like [Erigeron canadensis]
MMASPSLLDNKNNNYNDNTDIDHHRDVIISPRDVYIVGVARTPIGDFLGSLSSFSATQLGSLAIRCALERARIDPQLVQEVFFGNVLSANLGQAPARQAALGAGIPHSVVCTTINKVCSSGLKATMLAAQSIQVGANDIVVAGGMESMSNAPKYLTSSRTGSRLGHDSIIDSMIKDGLWDVYNDFGMGVCAELCADTYNITRQHQDNYAIRSFNRGISAQNNGAFAWEIVPVKVSGGKGKLPTVVDKDEALTKFDATKLRNLRPSFKVKGGSVTAGNASSISDGAAALVLVSGETASKLGLQVIAKIRGFADAAQAPELFTTAPALAIPKAISNAGLKASQIDYYEINEAFSVVALANQKLLGIVDEQINIHGGAVSLGHPLGCSGARILVTLLGVLRQNNGRLGVAGICNGGGGASALVLELMPTPRMSHSRL